MNIFGKRSDLPCFTQERSQEGEKRGFVYAGQNIICNQTLKTKHSWTTLRMSRPLFVGSYYSANEKEDKFPSNDNTFYHLYILLLETEPKSKAKKKKKK